MATDPGATGTTSVSFEESPKNGPLNTPEYVGEETAGE
jgi:hypothetical protein